MQEPAIELRDVAASYPTGRLALEGINLVKRYPQVAWSSNLKKPEKLIIASRFSDEVLAHLQRGGDVLLLGSRLDTAWTALPAAPAFVPFVDALVNRLARGEAPVAEAEGASRVEFRTRGADTVGATVYGPDARESDLTPTPPDLVRRTIGAEVLEDARFGAELFAGTRRVDVSGMLLALALLVAAVELGIATLTAMVSARVGLWWGNGMARVQR